MVWEFSSLSRKMSFAHFRIKYFRVELQEWSCQYITLPVSNHIELSRPFKIELIELFISFGSVAYLFVYFSSAVGIMEL